MKFKIVISIIPKNEFYVKTTILIYRTIICPEYVWKSFGYLLKCFYQYFYACTK